MQAAHAQGLAIDSLHPLDLTRPGEAARCVAHAEERRHGLVVQRAARRVQFDDVGARATRQFQRVHAIGVPGIEVGYDAAQAVEPHTK